MKKILVRGPALSRSGYGEQCRFALRALRAHPEDFDVYLVNTGWGHTGWLFEDTEERNWIDQTILKTIKKIQSPDKAFDVSLQVALPNEWQMMARTNIGYTAGVETDKVPESWVQYVGGMNKVIVTSNHTKSGFVAAGSNEDKFSVVNYPVREVTPTIPELDLATDYNFLTVAQWSPRKNIEATITSFVEEFTNENVGLILKTNIKNSSIIDRRYCQDRLNFIMSHFPEDRKCKIYLLHGNFSDEEMAGLYRHDKVNAYVSTSHGEGFGLPVFEAASAGVPIITCNWGGVVDFCNMPKGKSSTKTKPMIAEVAYEVANVMEDAAWEGIIETTASWCYPEIDSLRKTMREEYQKPSLNRAKRLKTYINKNNTVELKQKEFVDSILSTL